MSSPGRIYPPLYEEITSWPIYKLYDERDEFVSGIDSQTFDSLVERHGEEIGKLIARTAYLEMIRLKQSPWKSDPPNEMKFWRRVRKEVGENARHREDVAFDRNKELLRRVIHRYSEEIAGNFNKSTFLFARKFLTAFFKRLLNTASGKNYERIWGSKHNLHERIRIYGDIDKVRDCFSWGSVVIVPTHFSNLDSVLIGYALDSVAGLPSFSYGAGLNLYDSEIVAYYMSRLGAYRVDRRKRNPIYLETLKTMSNLSIQWGVNSLFFPGGTRSRSGSLETELKMGLLNSLVEAQRSIYVQGDDRKVIIIPLVLSYHFVLEARMLIDQFLERSGEEKYLVAREEFQSVRKILKFAWQFFSRSSSISLSFGEPMDVIGNSLDDHGNSIDKRGEPSDLKEYFMNEGQPQPNKQRESVYTKLLSKRIVESFYSHNVVLSSHITAFAAFEMLKRLYPDFDVFGLIRLPTDEFVFDRNLLLSVIANIRDHLLELEANGQVRISRDVRGKTPDEILDHGLSNLGVYHVQKPLMMTKRGDIISQSWKLLYYYHNRLENYDLDKVINWEEELVERAQLVASI